MNRCVKEVEYDAVHFSRHITISEYAHLLWLQTSEIATAEFRNSDPQICQYIATRRESMSWHTLCGDREHEWENRGYGAMAQYHKFAFVREGYEKWKEEATLEMRFSEEPTFLSSLILGLKQLSQLKAVKMRDTWSFDGKLSGEGSPLARSWNPFHAHPDMISDDLEGLKQSRASEDFWLLTSALHKAGRTGIRKLLLEIALPPSLFAVGSDEKEDRVNLGVAAYCTLKDLKFSLEINPRGFSYYLPVLKPMLGSMTSLKRLELDFDDVHLIEDYFSPFQYATVFPKKGHWPHVTRFTLIGLEIGTKDLITLLTTKMPSLRHLTFGRIGLLDGQWEGVVEYLRVSDRLSSFHIISESPLSQIEDSKVFPYFETMDDNDFSDIIHKSIISIEGYVVNWRHNPTLRHPSLRPDQPAQASLDYLHNVYRLCGMDDTVETLDRLAKHMVAEVARFTSSERTERK